jgi:hypothetical protein
VKTDVRITPEEAGTLERWLVMIGIAIAFILACLYGGLATAIAVMVIGVGVFFRAMVYLTNRYSQLSEQSQAIILERRVEIKKDDFGEKWNVYWVVIQFKTDEGQLTLRAQVTKSIYESVEPGATLGMRYNARDPRIALFEGEEANPA